MESNGSESCLGVAAIPLITLTQSPGVIRGLFELHQSEAPSKAYKQGDGPSSTIGKVGVIEMELRWEKEYPDKSGVTGDQNSTVFPGLGKREIAVKSAEKVVYCNDFDK